MRNAEFNKRQVIKYLILTFGVGYLMQVGVWFLSTKGDASVGRTAMSMMTALMFVPTLGVLFAGENLRGIGWRLPIRNNIPAIPFAWFGPALLTAIGAALYFMIFPGHLDLSGSILAASIGEEAFEQMKAQGFSFNTYLMTSVISALTYAPLINAVAAMGEEIGWRAFLYPQLKSKYGSKKGLLIGGLIWGAWHWPLIWLIGYEYGSDYFGFPVVGMLLFCIITIGLGIGCDWVYVRSGSIWLPAVFHGAFNAAAGIPLVICITGTGSGRLLGPAPNGILSGLPILAVALVLFLRAGGESTPEAA